MQIRQKKLLQGRWALAVMFAVNGTLMGAWAPQVPPLLTRHALSESLFGLIILIFGAGACLAMIFTGGLLARFGAVRVLRGVGLVTAAALPVVIHMPTVLSLAITMPILGSLIGCMDVAMNANAVEVEKEIGRPIMSSMHGFWSLGGFLGGFLGSYLVAHIGALPQSLWIGGGSGIAAFCAMPFLFETAPEVVAKDTRVLPRVPALWLLGAMALAMMIPEGAILDWSALYLQQNHGSNLFRAGLAFTFFSGAMAVMRFSGDSLKNRFGAKRVLRFSGAIASLGLLGAAFAPTDSAAMVCFAAAGLGIANGVPLIFSAAGNFPNIPTGAALSVVTMVGYAGILFAPAFIGYLAEWIGFPLTFCVIALLPFMVAVLSARVKL